MHTNQCPDLFRSYRESFNMNTRIKNSVFVDENISFTQNARSAPLIFASVKNKW